jgi:serine/threonine protein kinase
MGELPTVKFDIFALGCVAYQMLSRHEPYEDFDSPLERVGRPAPRLAETGRAKRVSDDLAGLVADMLSLDPSQRPTARQVSDRLLQCRESQAQPQSRLGDDEITNAELLSISPLHATPLLPADLDSHTMPGGPPMEIMEAARRALAPTVRGQSLEGLGRGFSESVVNVLAHTELAPESAVKQGSGEFDIAAQAMVMAQRAALRMAHTRSLTSSGMPAPNTARVVDGMLSPSPPTSEPTGPSSFAKGASKTLPLQSSHSVPPRTQSGTLPMQAAFSRDSVAPPPPAHAQAGHSAASALVRSARPGSTPRETADAVAAARAAATEEKGRGGRALVAVVAGIVIALVILAVVGGFLRLHR